MISLTPRGGARTIPWKLRSAPLLVVFGTMLAVLAIACSGSPAGELSEEEQVRQDAIDWARLRLDPHVWSIVEAQGWYAGGDPSDDGLRLMNLLATYYAGENPQITTDVIGYYPEGISSEREQLVLRLRSSSLIRSMLASEWVRDGVDANEQALLGLLSEAADHRTRARNWTFDSVLLETTRMPWFRDGLNERETAMLGAATALSFQDNDLAAQLIAAVPVDSFLTESVTLPLSGEKTLVVTSEVPGMERNVASALATVKQRMVEVEAFVGPYFPRYVVVTVEQLRDVLCGTGRGQAQETPGVVTLNVDCVREATIVHELAHVFAGFGPVWFAEGVADLVLHHVTGATGSYLGQRATGRMELDGYGSPNDPDLTFYRTQGALGAHFFMDLYRLLGPEVMSDVIEEMSLVEWPRRGQLVLDALLAVTPPEHRAAVESLIDERF